MRNNAQQEPKEFEEKVIQISRVSKKTKGGNNVGFSVLMVVGDRKGQVGVGLGKAKDVVSAIKKGIKKAKKKMITVPLNGTTIPFAITVKKGAGRVMLKPAPKGSGVIAGGPVRSVVEAAGVRDISSKILGSENQSSSVYATFEALTQIQRIVELKGIKLKSLADVDAEEALKSKELQQKHAKRGEDIVKKPAAKKVAAQGAKKPAAKKVVAQGAKKPVAKKVVAKKTKSVVAAKKAPAEKKAVAPKTAAKK